MELVFVAGQIDRSQSIWVKSCHLLRTCWIWGAWGLVTWSVHSGFDSGKSGRQQQRAYGSCWSVHSCGTRSWVMIFFLGKHTPLIIRGDDRALGRGLSWHVNKEEETKQKGRESENCWLRILLDCLKYSSWSTMCLKEDLPMRGCWWEKLHGRGV